MQPIRVFIGYDRVEEVAFHVLSHSIHQRSSVPVSTTPLIKDQLFSLVNRPREPEQSNEFTFTRWLVPYLCNYEGFAIFVDCDMMFRADIAELYNLRDRQFAVQCVKHNHVPQEKTKFLKQMQTVYDKKNWASVMIFNNAFCQVLSPDYINTTSRLKLHQFNWLPTDELIGELPKEWNHLVGYDKPNPDAKNVHWTLGGPYFNEYRDVEFSDEWYKEFNSLTHCEQMRVQK